MVNTTQQISELIARYATDPKSLGQEELRILMAHFRAENSKIVQEAIRRTKEDFSLSVSDLGAVKITGLGWRYPVTLYREQLATIFSHTADINAFIEANKEAIDARLKNAPEVRKARKAAAKKANK